MPKPKSRKAIALNAIYFGKDDAESDFAAGGLLQQGFLRTMAYEEALAGRKTLFVGRKGSGKSAICLILHSALLKSNRVALITPDEISAEEIRRFGLAGISPESSKELIWRYVFAVQIAKFLLVRAKEQKQDAAVRKCVDSIRRFLVDNNEIEDLSAASRFWKTIERLKGKISFEAFSVKVGIEGEVPLNHPSPGTLASEQLDRLESHLRLVGESLKIVSKSSRFYLLVDQVEKVWSNDPESNSMVIGLLLAAKRVGIVFPFVQCTLFLRTDIYESVRFQEGDKFRTDEFRIVWDKKSLLELALTRAKVSSPAALAEKELWGKVFPTDVDSEQMPAFLVDMTLMRPRDIIQLCNSCRYTAQANGHEAILPDDVKQAAKTFSTWKLNDIQNEWLINYPFLPDVLLLLSNRTFLFTKSSFSSALSLISGDLVQRYPAFRHILASSDALLQILHSIGVIGIMKNGTPVYNYQVASDQKPEPTDKEFVIHPAFRFALQSELAIGAAPFQFDGAFLKSRVGMGIRGVGEQAIGPHYIFSGLSSIMRQLDIIQVSIGDAACSAELKKALTKNVTSVQRQLREARKVDDDALLRSTLVQVLRYASKFEDALADGGVMVDRNILDELNKFTGLLRDAVGGGVRLRGGISA